jgi:hypothetical protein
MSRGPGRIEARIADLFAVTRDRALAVDEIARHAYGLPATATPSRVQRLAATRTTHRLLRRVREAHKRAHELVAKAHAETETALGYNHETAFKPLRGNRCGDDRKYRAYWDYFDARPARLAAHKLHDYCDHVGRWFRIVQVEDKPGWRCPEHDFWIAESHKGRLMFHPPDVPLRLWAVSMDAGGITWAEATVTRITARNVMARYAGENARLDRESLWRWWAFWRGVRFVSSRTGRIAAELEVQWWKRYGTSGGVPPSMQMPLADAIALLGVPDDYTKADVLAAFRGKAKLAHPDAGGTAEMFRKLTEARDRLLAAVGTKARPPKPPSYAPKGVDIVYRRVRLGSPQRRLASSGGKRLR